MPEKLPTAPLLNTPSPAAHKLELLRQLFPQAVQTAPDGSVRVDAAQIQRALDPTNAQGIRVEETGYELRWVGKQEAYHTAFARTNKVVNPVPSDSKNWDSTGNLLLKGDNLDALKLLRQSYFGKIKLIYIDPPYNTKSDEFIYRDDFTARQTDILAQLGYSADNVEYIQNIYSARTHSGWLSFMYPRLLLAKDLLRDDGVIFISIDDNEQAQLKLLCDEVFGQENFVGELALLCNPKGRSQDKYFATNHEYVLAYSKCGLEKGALSVEKDADEIEANYDEVDDDGERYRLLELRNTHREFGRHNRKNLYYPFYVSDQGDVTLFPMNGEVKEVKVVPDWDDGFEGCWTWDRIKAEKDIALLTAKHIKGKWKIYRKSYASGANRMLKTILHDKSFYTQKGQKELNALLNTRSKIFPSPKSPWLIAALAQTVTSGQDLTLDFFAGSGTTGEAIMRLNAEDGGQRQFILVQIPQPIDPKKQKEAHDFVTHTLGKNEATIFEITAERLRRAGDKINAEQVMQGKPEVDAGFRVYALVDDPHALVRSTRLDEATQTDVAALQAAIATPQLEQRPVVLANLLLTEGLPLSATLEPLAAAEVVDALWQAQDTLFVLDSVPLDALTDLLRARKAALTPVHHVSVYAPWVHDDNFLQGVQTLLEMEGFSPDRLRLRG